MNETKEYINVRNGIEGLYKKYNPMVYRRCLRLLRDEAEAYEAMQDTFLRLLQTKKEIFFIQGSGFSSFFYQVATRVCLNLLRSRKRYDELITEHKKIDLISEKTAKSIESEIHSRWAVEELFKNQSSSTNRMVVRFFYEKVSLDQLAKEFKVSISGIRKRLKKFQSATCQLKETEKP